ncbi:MAG: hypothetical protein AAF597_05065, partial [Bacteroidota bacterium]
MISTRILHAQAIAAYSPQNIATALEQLEQVLKDADITEEQCAHTYLVCYELSGYLDQGAKNKALELYEKLYAKTPKFIYNHNMELLSKQR